MSQLPDLGRLSLRPRAPTGVAWNAQQWGPLNNPNAAGMAQLADRCPICLEPLSNEALERGAQNRLTGKGGQRVVYCGRQHVLHAGCALSVLGSAITTCPMCKDPPVNGLRDTASRAMLEPHATTLETATAPLNQRRAAALVLGDLAGGVTDGELYASHLQARLRMHDVMVVLFPSAPPSWAGAAASTAAAEAMSSMKLVRAMLYLDDDDVNTVNQLALTDAAFKTIFDTAMGDPHGTGRTLTHPSLGPLAREAMRALKYALLDNDRNAEWVLESPPGGPLDTGFRRPVELLGKVLSQWEGDQTPFMPPGEVSDLLSTLLEYRFLLRRAIDEGVIPSLIRLLTIPTIDVGVKANVMAGFSYVVTHFELEDTPRYATIAQVYTAARDLWYLSPSQYERLMQYVAKVTWRYTFRSNNNEVLAFARMILGDAAPDLRRKRKRFFTRQLIEALQPAEVAARWVKEPCARLLFELASVKLSALMDTLQITQSAPGYVIPQNLDYRELRLMLQVLAELAHHSWIKERIASQEQPMAMLKQLLVSSENVVHEHVIPIFQNMVVGSPACQATINTPAILNILPRSPNGTYTTLVKDLLDMAQVADPLANDINAMAGRALTKRDLDRLDIAAQLYVPSGAAATLVYNAIGMQPFVDYLKMTRLREAEPFGVWEWCVLMQRLVHGFPEAQDACRAADLIPYLVSLVPKFLEQDDAVALAEIFDLALSLTKMNNTENKHALAFVNVWEHMWAVLNVFHTSTDLDSVHLVASILNLMRSLISENERNLSIARSNPFLMPLLKGLRDQDPNDDQEGIAQSASALWTILATVYT
jgi:hypothetical protein